MRLIKNLIIVIILSIIIFPGSVFTASQDGTEDTAFYTNLGTGFDATIFTTSIQSDGKIIVGGNFTDLNGNTRNRLVRLNADGTEDVEDFYNNLGTGFDATIRTTSIQSDGKIMVGGNFTDLNGNTRNHLVRLNSDGTEDTSFYTNLGTGFNNTIFTTSIQSDGKILVGGHFDGFNGNTRNYIVRLNADGTEDASFYYNLGNGFDFIVWTISIQSDGKIIVGGQFTDLNSNTRNYLVRLNSDGTEDTAFYTNLGTGFDTRIFTTSIQSDGKILVGGEFTNLNSGTRYSLVRLNADGTEDTSFYTNLGTGFNNTIYTTSIQSDGKILVGGDFQELNVNTRSRFVRLNSDGTEDTSFYTNLGAGFENTIFTTSIQSDGKILVGGDFTNLNGNTRNRLVRLNSEPPPLVIQTANSNTTGSEIILTFEEALDTGIIPEKEDFDLSVDNSSILISTIAVSGSTVTLTPSSLLTANQIVIINYTQGVNKITGDTSRLEASTFSTFINTTPISRTNSDGTEDTSFYTNLGTGFNATIRTTSIQSDGKILVGGEFDGFNGNTRNRLVRLNSDGTEDTSFYYNLGNGFDFRVLTTSIQSNGKILVGGEFTDLNGNTRFKLVRLNADGTEDTAFYTNLGTGFSSSVLTISIQSDGKILVGGEFTDFNSNPRNRLVRLNSDGTEDTSFYTNLGAGFNATIFTTSIQSDGKILVGGDFTDLNGNTRNFLVRLNADGTEDTSTNFGGGRDGFSSSVLTISIQSDGKILVGGDFTDLNSNTRNYLVRLNADGTEDTAFYTNLGTGFDAAIRTISIQSDGKILVGGHFSELNGNTRSKLVRLNADGTEDTAFYTNLGTGFTNIIYTTSIQSDGKILVGGDFPELNGNTRNRFVRLTRAPTPLLSSLNTNIAGTNIVITYDILLNSNSTPEAGDFVVTVNGIPVTVSSVVVSESTVTLAITPLIVNGQTINLSYAPGVNPIEGTLGGDAVPLVVQAVTNSVPAVISAPTAGAAVIILNTATTSPAFKNTPIIQTSTDQACTPLFTKTQNISLLTVNDIDEVKKVENFLNQNEGESLEVNGIYEQIDAEAVKRFQNKYFSDIIIPFGGKNTTGIVGPYTKGKMNVINCTKNIDCPYFKSNHRINSTGGDVKIIQSFLNILLNSNIPESGTFDSRTFTAVKNYQTLYRENILDPLGLKSATGIWHERSKAKGNMLMGCPGI